MSWLNDRQRRDLDNYITGHYGEDQFRGEKEMGFLYWKGRGQVYHGRYRMSWQRWESAMSQQGISGMRYWIINTVTNKVVLAFFVAD